VERLEMWDVIITDHELPDNDKTVTFASEGQAIAFMQGWNSATEYWDRPGAARVEMWRGHHDPETDEFIHEPGC
jgi:hypothetical protein